MEWKMPSRAQETLHSEPLLGKTLIGGETQDHKTLVCCDKTTNYTVASFVSYLKLRVTIRVTTEGFILVQGVCHTSTFYV